MAEDWLQGDPFAAEDPEATERERRRLEREERRHSRSGGPPPPEPPPRAPDPPRPPELPPSSPPSSGDGSGRSTGVVVAVTVLAVLVLGAAAVFAYRQLDGEDAPPPMPPKTITATVPEGYDREQTAALAEELGLRGDYLKASVRSPILDPAEFGGAGAESLEGFLFPDTFELNARAPARELVDDQLRDFKRRIKGVNMRYARSKNLTVYDVLTIASMVEEEAKLEGERKLIAAVIYNRLREGIPLGIDATIRFATGNHDEPLTESELATDSPYNTRLDAGLPPGPISSPGLASIEAAARPASVDYLYYVVQPGTCGKHSFSETDAEFQADVARYNEARAAAGGESPDSCGE